MDGGASKIAKSSGRETSLLAKALAQKFASLNTCPTLTGETFLGVISNH